MTLSYVYNPSVQKCSSRCTKITQKYFSANTKALFFVKIYIIFNSKAFEKNVQYPPKV